MLTMLMQAGGALLFIVALLGWYMTFVIMSAEMRLGINFWVSQLERKMSGSVRSQRHEAFWMALQTPATTL